MKLILILLLFAISLVAVDVKVVPTLKSNPTSGTGLGAMSSIIYQADEKSSPSQALIIASYTNSGSYNAFGINNMYFDNDNYISRTIVGYVFNNSEFDLSSDTPSDIVLPQSDANFQVEALILNQQLLYKIFTDLYIGGQAFYIKQSFDSTNDLGSAFLLTRGIEDSSLGSLGVIIEYDTRSKSEKHYPRNAQYAEFILNYSPKSFGNTENFTTLEINYRKYMHGFKEDDVIATQLYLKTSSQNTPDASLPALGLKNILRGFSIGQYKARTLAALQGEYRYELTNTNFIFTTFLGYANLSGGSKGTAFGNRDADNGSYVSGGLGTQYFIQKKAGVVYRVDLVTTNKNEQSVYATVNQAF